MEHRDKTAYYKNLKYEVRVTKSGDNYVVGIPELGLRRKGTDLNTIHEALISDKDELVTELCAEGLDSWIILPGGTSPQIGTDSSVALRSEPISRQMLVFGMKLGSLLVFFALVGVAIGNAVSGAGRGIERDFHKIRTWPESKVEEYRKSTRETMQRLKPIIDEIRVGLAQDESSRDMKKP